MDTKMTTMPRITIQSGIPFNSPDPDSFLVSANDPAERVMTDFLEVVPVTIEPGINIDIAVNKMRTAGVRLLLVTDDNDYISGVITSYDIQGELPIKYSQEHGINRDRITVEMLMVPLEKIPAFDYSTVKQSLVRHVVATFRELERPHALVVQTDERSKKQTVRGIFSSAQISKLLGRSVYTPLHAGNSLADIQHEMQHPTI